MEKFYSIVILIIITMVIIKNFACPYDTELEARKLHRESNQQIALF
jgi:hypothetical protein